MAQNSLYPGYVRIHYTVAGRPHKQIIPVEPEEPYDPGVSATDVQFWLRDGVTTVSFADAMDSYDDVLDDGLNSTDAAIALAEYYQLATPTSDPEFVCIYEIGHAGANATATVPYSQKTTSFRTSAGGYYKHVVMDQTAAVNTEDAFPFSAGSTQLALWNYLNSVPGGWVRGRDGGKIISGINSVTKTNDALRKKYLLNS